MSLRFFMMKNQFKSKMIGGKKMFNRHIKEIRCLDCKHCDVKEMKCYPESLDCKPEYDLDYEDIYEYHKNNCDFYNMDY